MTGGGTAQSTQQQVASPQTVRERKHFSSNESKAGIVEYTSNDKFSKRYPLPSEKAQAGRIGRSSRVFIMYHLGQTFIVLKTIFNSKQIRIHSKLLHPNIMVLEAVLIGEEHEDGGGKHYAYHFMPKMDISFGDVLYTREDGCLKQMKIQLTKRNREQWALVLVNVRHVLTSVLKALGYLHSQKLSYGNIKASDILIKMRCQCEDLLFCTCHKQQKAIVKLGDFSSSSDMTGYELLYTTAVDVWSFGCFLIATFLGERGSLLLATEEQVIKELPEVYIYYADTPELCELMQKCLQVDPKCRPTAKELLTLDFFTKPL